MSAEIFWRIKLEFAVERKTTVLGSEHRWGGPRKGILGYFNTFPPVGGNRFAMNFWRRWWETLTTTQPHHIRAVYRGSPIGYSQKSSIANAIWFGGIADKRDLNKSLKYDPRFWKSKMAESKIPNFCKCAQVFSPALNIKSNFLWWPRTSRSPIIQAIVEESKTTPGKTGKD